MYIYVMSMKTRVRKCGKQTFKQDRKHQIHQKQLNFLDDFFYTQQNLFVNCFLTFNQINY